MSETTASLRRKIDGAADLQSVVRSMKALAAANIGQYERSVRALADYFRTVELGLSVCFRKHEAAARPAEDADEAGAAEDAVAVADAHAAGAVVFGSDQGLVGQFNDVVVDFALGALAARPGTTRVWAVGERVQARLADAGRTPAGCFEVPNSVEAIAPLVARILVECEARSGPGPVTELHLYYNSPGSGSVYAPVGRQLLPLDAPWQAGLAGRAWPTDNLPEVVGGEATTLRELVSEYLFVSLYRACAESLASENASRLAAMQRADRNIDELLEDLTGRFHRLRQGGIDEELFDVVSGFEALVRPAPGS